MLSEFGGASAATIADDDETSRRLDGAFYARVLRDRQLDVKSKADESAPRPSSMFVGY